MPYQPQSSARPAQTTSGQTLNGITADNILRGFKYFRVIDKGRSTIVKNGDVYPIAHNAPPNSTWTQGVRNGRSVEISMEFRTVSLLGVKNANGRAAKPWLWDARRGEILSFDQLNTAEQQRVAQMLATQDVQ